MSVFRFIYNIPAQIFGCRHGQLSRPFTIDAESYMVCLDCGTQVFYSPDTMRRLSGRELRRKVSARVNAQDQLQVAAGEETTRLAA